MIRIRVRTLALAILAGSAFALMFVSVGIRWHTYRARAALYARQEMEHTFEAANLARAARNPGISDEAQTRALGFKRLAEMHRKAALECTRLREVYENCW